jgi:hypothetical protein
MQALMPHTATFGIEARHLLAVIDGCQMDLEQNRYLDFANLQQYCHLVAGVVGEVAASIFGQTQPQTTDYAHQLGLAFQLTNIIRDVGEDAARGRIYLPVNELQRFDVKAHELLKRGAAPGTDTADFQRSIPGADEVPVRACAADLRRGPGPTARSRPTGAEARPDDGQHLPHPAEGNRHRAAAGADAARRPDAAAQVVAGLEGPGAGQAMTSTLHRWAGRERP